MSLGIICSFLQWLVTIDEEESGMSEVDNAMSKERGERKELRSGDYGETNCKRARKERVRQISAPRGETLPILF